MKKKQLIEALRSVIAVVQEVVKTTGLREEMRETLEDVDMDLEKELDHIRRNS